MAASDELEVIEPADAALGDVEAVAQASVTHEASPQSPPRNPSRRLLSGGL